MADKKRVTGSPNPPKKPKEGDFERRDRGVPTGSTGPKNQDDNKPGR